MKRVKLILLTLFLASLTLFGDQGALRLWELMKISHTLEKQNRNLERQSRELTDQIGRLKEPEYLERLIREERGYIEEGETIVEIPNSP